MLYKFREKFIFDISLHTFVGGPSVAVRGGQLLTIGPEHVLVVRGTFTPPAFAHAAVEAAVLARLRAPLHQGERATAAHRQHARRHAHKGGRVGHDGRGPVVNVQLVVTAALAVPLLVETLVHMDHQNFHTQRPL